MVMVMMMIMIVVAVVVTGGFGGDMDDPVVEIQEFERRREGFEAKMGIEKSPVGHWLERVDSSSTCGATRQGELSHANCVTE